MSTLLTIDLGALEANFRFCSKKLRPASVAAVVKADAYGLSVQKIAPLLWHAGCRQFFTATHREGITLRALLPEAEIYILEGVTDQSLSAVVENALIPVLITPAHSSLWAAQAHTAGRPLPAVIHIDTGMTRLGFGERELKRLLEQDDDLDWLEIRYVMTHFACADEPGADKTRDQLERFNRLRQLLPRAPTSVGNSAGGLLGREYAGDMARLGIALFGGNPYRKEMPDLKPVLTVQSRILQVREVDAGATVGYGATFSAKQNMRIATVGIGYADGYPWSLGNRGVASIGGHRVPVVGRVSMDMITLDVTEVPDEFLQPGHMVDLIGPNISLEEVAELAGTINYEILTRLSQRARRKYINDPVCHTS
ncbi:MAG: alanine racemase [Xanthomonadales bacterium]|nr:alanine racemase [Gammaproteobacteria bacterium]MBT8054454.1 alanine racemase [Gammaproteobacteria bacterium]NNK50111.1 alanine racemase [Xanthomonadales bacterium]